MCAPALSRRTPSGCRIGQNRVAERLYRGLGFARGDLDEKGEGVAWLPFSNDVAR